MHADHPSEGRPDPGPDICLPVTATNSTSSRPLLAHPIHHTPKHVKFEPPYPHFHYIANRCTAPTGLHGQAPKPFRCTTGRLRDHPNCKRPAGPRAVGRLHQFDDNVIFRILTARPSIPAASNVPTSALSLVSKIHVGGRTSVVTQRQAALCRTSQEIIRERTGQRGHLTIPRQCPVHTNSGYTLYSAPHLPFLADSTIRTSVLYSNSFKFRSARVYYVGSAR